jgi:hypothetical protein
MITKFKKPVAASGTTIENEPIIKSDGASSNVMQWLSNNEASNITISEDASNNLDLVVSAGNVGVGGTPAKLLDLHDDTEPVLRLSNTKDWPSGTGNIGSLEFYTTDPSTPGGARVLSSVRCVNEAGSSTPGGELVFSTAAGGGSGAAAVERMRIDSAGVVNISNYIDVIRAGKNQLRAVDTTAQAAGVGGSIDLGGNYRTVGDAGAFTRIAAEKTNSTDNDFGYNLGFYVTTNGGASMGKKAMTISSAGLATFSNGINLGNTASATATTLDGYEEGTWTAALTGTTATIGNATGKYVRIGSTVWVSWYSQGVDLASSTGAAIISGLPFENFNSVLSYTPFTYMHGTAVDGDSPGGYININSTQMLFIDNLSTSSASFIDGSDKYIMVTAVYQTDEDFN